MKYLSALFIIGLLLSACEDKKEENSEKEETSRHTEESSSSDSLIVEDENDSSEVEEEVFLDNYFEEWIKIESWDKLVETVGEENVTLDSTWEYEGTELKLSSRVYPGTEKEVRYVWTDDSKTNYEMLEVKITRYDEDQEKVVWNREMKTMAGIHTKMTLKELEGRNAAPISFAGFGWDNGGVITSFNGGRFEHARFSMTLAPMNYLDNQHPPIDDKYIGDKIFSTAENPELLEEDIIIASFYLIRE